jgi:hypothetical protein
MYVHVLGVNKQTNKQSKEEEEEEEEECDV